MDLDNPVTVTICPTVVHHDIIAELNKYEFPDDIKQLANQIYNHIYCKNRRGKVRRQERFYSVYQAHLQLGRRVNPIELGATMGLTVGDVNRCASLFSHMQTGYQPLIMSQYAPVGFLAGYGNRINLTEEQIHTLMLMGRTILDNNTSLIHCGPYTVAAAIFQYFADINGIKMSPTLFREITGRSRSTIEALMTTIQAAYNG